jgi:hypothetical protein
VPAELAAICNKATSAKPEHRYADALTFKRALVDYLRHRASVALSDEAAVRLAEARGRSAERDPGRTHQLTTEARFGFTQALREWKDNAAARAGLTDCIVAMIEHELAQKDRDGALALLAELPTPRPDLAERIEALARELEGTAAREERLKRIEADQDLTVGSGERVALLIMITLAAVALTAIFVPRRASDYASMILASSVILGGSDCSRRPSAGPWSPARRSPSACSSCTGFSERSWRCRCRRCSWRICSSSQRCSPSRASRFAHRWRGPPGLAWSAPSRSR